MDIATTVAVGKEVKDVQPRKLQLSSYIHTFLMLITFIIVGCVSSMTGPTLLDLKENVNEKIGKMGIIFTASSIGLLIGGLGGGVFLDILKNRLNGIILFTITISLATIFIPLCRSLYTLCASMFLMGMSLASLNIGIHVYCLHIWGEDANPFMQTLHFTYAIGGFSGPLIAAQFLENRLTNTEANSTHINITEMLRDFSDAHNFTYDEMFSANCTTGKVNSTEGSEPQSNFPRITYAYLIVFLLGCIVILLWILLYCSAFRKVGLSCYKKDDKNVKLPGRRFTVMVVVITSFMMFLQSGSETAFSQMLATYAVDGGFGFTKQGGSYLTSIYWGTYMVMTFVAIFISYRINAFLMIGIDALTVMCACVILIVGSKHNIYCMWVGVGMVGAGLASLFPTTIALLDRHINVTNKIASVFVALGAVSDMVVPNLLANYVEVEPFALFYFMMFDASLFALLFIVISLLYRRQGEKYIYDTPQCDRIFNMKLKNRNQ